MVARAWASMSKRIGVNPGSATTCPWVTRCVFQVSVSSSNSDSPSLRGCEDKHLNVARHLLNDSSSVTHVYLKQCLASGWSSLSGTVGLIVFFLQKECALTAEKLQSKKKIQTGEKGNCLKSYYPAANWLTLWHILFVLLLFFITHFKNIYKIQKKKCKEKWISLTLLLTDNSMIEARFLPMVRLGNSKKVTVWSWPAESSFSSSCDVAHLGLTLLL